MKLKDKMNKQYTQLSVYVILTAIIIYSLSLLAKSAPEVLEYVMKKVSWILNVVKPIVLGFVFAYLVEPSIEFFEERYKKLKILKKKQASCRVYAVFTTVVILIIVVLMLISLLVFSVTDQIRLANLDDIILIANGYMKSFSEFYSAVMQKLSNLDIQSSELQNYVTDSSAYAVKAFQNIANNILGSISNISSYLTTIIFSVIIGVYFLIDGQIIKDYLKRVFHALFSNKVNKRIGEFLNDADTVFSGYIRGQLMDAFVMMILISITLSIIGVKFAIVIGIMAGIGNLIPFCGPFVAYAGTILISVMNGQYKKMIIAIIALFIIQTIDGNIIGPKLLSHSIKIHPLLIIISLIFGSAIGGLLGMLLAVPVGAFIKVLFVRFIDYRIEAKETAMKKE